jgi:hypothetical protein
MGGATWVSTCCDESREQISQISQIGQIGGLKGPDQVDRWANRPAIAAWADAGGGDGRELFLRRRMEDIVTPRPGLDQPDELGR